MRPRPNPRGASTNQTPIDSDPRNNSGSSVGSGAQFTGGTLFDRVSNFGVGCPLRDTGGWNVSPNAHPAGYTAEVAGKTDIDCQPTATETGTWGKLKSTYR